MSQFPVHQGHDQSLLPSYGENRSRALQFDGRRKDIEQVEDSWNMLELGDVISE